jgi:hypothetical protein
MKRLVPDSSRFYGLRLLCAVLALPAATAMAQPAADVVTLFSLNSTDGAYPYYAGLVQGADGYLYDTA